jgi:hypothetical protein
LLQLRLSARIGGGEFNHPDTNNLKLDEMANNVCLPVQLEAFILNEPVVDNGPTLIAPIVEPNYVSLEAPKLGYPT